MDYMNQARKKKALLDPRTKLMLTIVTSAYMLNARMNGIHLVIEIILLGLITVLLIVEKRVVFAISSAVLIGISVFCGAYLAERLPEAVNLGIMIFAMFIGRFLPGIVAGYYSMTTTTVSEFIAAMERMHMPRIIIIPLSVMFRFFPTIGEEAKDIDTAMRMRGIGILNNPGKAIEYKLIPTVMATARIGEELSAASLTKGLSVEAKRVNVCHIGFGVLDYILMIFFVISLGFYVGM